MTDDAFLDTIAGDATIRGATPSMTLVPKDSGGARALALLAQLAEAAPVASLQLKTGEVIGEGGMGIVRVAEQVALGRQVAVKTLKRKDPAAALDLLREAWVTGSIEHPNVVPVHYLGADADGQPVIVLKRIEGVEWSQLAGNAGEVGRRFGATDLLAWNLGILMQVLNAVRFAHHRGVIHRDLKPQNVMIGDFGEVYLLDWGIAVSLRDDGTGRLPLAANAHDPAGTPHYMAPEMLGRDSDAPLSERTDVYLAGAVLFELVTGEPPHTGKTALEVLANIIHGKVEVPASVPPELARICTRALHDDPAQRFDSAEALRLAIQRYLDHRGSAELVTRARARLDELTQLLAAPAERDDVYRLFGACRFGFHEALAVWRENEEARSGLLRATVAVAEYELANDHPDAAVTLLTDLDSPPSLLARAKEAAADRHARTAELEKMRADHDSTIGRRTRSFLAGGLGIGFTILPLFAAIWPDVWRFTPARLVSVSFATEVLVLLAAWWAWDTLGATLFNRRIAATTIFVFAAQTVLAGGMWIADVPPPITQTCMEVLWGTIVAMLAITLERRFAYSAVAYFAGFMLSARFPAYRMYIVAVANFGFGVSAYIVWRPATLKMTDEEREWVANRARSRRK